MHVDVDVFITRLFTNKRNMISMMMMPDHIKFSTASSQVAAIHMFTVKLISLMTGPVNT